MSTSARSIPRPAGASRTPVAGSAVAPAGLTRHFAAGAALVVAVALALRIYHLGANSFWIDEINVASFVRSGHLLTDLRARGGPFEPPLHFVSVWLATRLLPMPFEAAARVPAALFGTLEVVALIGVTRRLTRRKDLALLAGALLALAPFAVRYSQEARYYTTFSALHLLTWWLLTRAIENDRTVDFVLWGVALALLLLAHPFAPLVLLVQVLGAWWWIRRGTREGFVERPDRVTAHTRLTVVIAALIALPWFLWGLIRWIPDLIDGRSYALNPPGRARVALNLDLFKRIVEWVLGNTGRMTPLVFALVVLAVASPFVARRGLRAVARVLAVYTLGFLVVLVPLAWVLRTPLAVRRVEFVLAPVILLAVLAIDGCGAWLAARRHDRAARLVTHLLPIVLLVLSFAATAAYYTTEKSAYREVARVVGQTPRDALVVIGPIDVRWKRSIERYLGWQGVDRPVRFIIAGKPVPELARPPSNRVVWITPSKPDSRTFRSQPLNSVPDLQVIAGDRTAPAVVLPWFASETHPLTDRQLRRQAQLVSRLPANDPPPEGSGFPWYLVTGR